MGENDHSPFSILDDSIVVRVYVKPGAKKFAIHGVHDGQLCVFVSEAAKEGKATRAVRDGIASVCGIPKTRVVLLSGEKSRQKRFKLQGCGQETKDILQSCLSG